MRRVFSLTYRVLLTLAGCLLGFVPAMAAGDGDTVPVVQLQRGADTASLASATRYLRDPTGDASVQTMFARAEAGEFAPLPHDNATFGFADGAYWFHLRLRNLDHSETRWLLVQEYALLDFVDLYVRGADGQVQHFASGDFRPFHDRAVHYRHPNFWLDLPPGRELDLLLRTASKSSMQVPLKLYTTGAFLEMSRDAQLGIGLYYGILIALLAYNLILSLSLRDMTHFLYSTHVAGFGLVQFCLNGLAFEYLWPNSPWLANAAVPMSMALAMLAMHLFARNFLELPKRSRPGNVTLLILIFFHTAMLVLSTFIDYRIAVLIGTAAVFPGVCAIIVAAIAVARRGYRPALLFLVAWAALLIGTTVYAMVSFGVLPKTFATEYGMQIGSAAEMILLSFALAYRWASLRSENERIVRDAKDRLEQRVQERTLELSAALSQLGEANMRLRENSQRDGLTEAYNRRHVDAHFEPMLQRALSQGLPFSLLVVDIDHFKQVNDVNGHLAGDDCLRAVANLLRDAAGDAGVVARFGGEEFLILMPGADELSARRTAEYIRLRIASTPIKADGAPVQLTVSIGVATATALTAFDAQGLMRRADEALYEAKRGGRNRVVQRLAAA